MVSIAEYFIIGKKYSNFITAKTIGIFLGMLAIVASFYTYSGIIGRNFLIADILTYVIGAAVMALATIRTVTLGKLVNKKYRCIAILALIFMAILFAIYTYNPPNLNIFEDAAEAASILF